MAETITAVLVGCGGISRTWLDAIAPADDIALLGLVDIREEAAQHRAAQYGLSDTIVGTNLAQMLDATLPDVVFDCTLPEAHAEVTTEALAHGCHVLGEKPMAVNVESAQKMIAAAQSSGLLYAVMQNRRYDPNIRGLRAFLDTGSVGSVTTINSDFYLGAHFGGFRERMKHVLLVDMAIHTFDAARFLTGADPVSVYCKDWNPAGSWYESGASAVAIFEMTGGVVYTYRGSWCAEGLPTTWESEWRVIGDEGTAVWDGADQMTAQAAVAPDGMFSKVADLPVPQHDSSSMVSGHAGLIGDFIECIRQGSTPATICTDNIKSLAMVCGAVESAERGEKVTIDY